SAATTGNATCPVAPVISIFLLINATDIRSPC
ncbi:MAG: hypothetical protein ACI8RO_001737, partial [Flavobacteriales bacterium]